MYIPNGCNQQEPEPMSGSSVEMLCGGTKQLVTEPNITVDSSNDLNGTGNIDSTNLDINSETKSYDSKMPPTLAPATVLNVDADNYMLRGSMEQTRPRSFSFTNGSSSGQDSVDNRQHAGSKNPLDLDMFCVRETVSSLAAVLVPESSPPAAPGCARTLSYHTLLCSCHLSCCCMCDSLCPPDCHACLHAVCVRFANNHVCQRNTELLPPVTLAKDKVRQQQIILFTSVIRYCCCFAVTGVCDRNNVMSL